MGFDRHLHNRVGGPDALAIIVKGEGRVSEAGYAAQTVTVTLERHCIKVMAEEWRNLGCNPDVKIMTKLLSTEGGTWPAQ